MVDRVAQAPARMRLSVSSLDKRRRLSFIPLSSANRKLAHTDLLLGKRAD